MSRPALATLLYASLLPAVQARCGFFRDDDDDDDDDECVGHRTLLSSSLTILSHRRWHCDLSTGARVGIGIGVGELGSSMRIYST